MVTMGLCAMLASPARANVVLVGSDKIPEHKEAIDAAQKSAPQLSFADEDSVDAAEQLRHADVILAVGTRALIMARTVAPDKPIVYAMVPAAEAQAGRSITGVALEVPAYARIRAMEAAALRRAAHRACLRRKRANVARRRGANRAAGALGLQLAARPADDAAHAAAAVAELSSKVDAVWLAGWPFPDAVAKWSRQARAPQPATRKRRRRARCSRSRPTRATSAGGRRARRSASSIARPSSGCRCHRRRRARERCCLNARARRRSASSCPISS